MSKHDIQEMVKSITTTLVGSGHNQEAILAQSRHVQNVLGSDPTRSTFREPVMSDRSWWLVKENYTLEDNSGTHLDMTVRNGLRGVNSSPSKYAERVSQKVEPVRGQSLYLQHLLGTDHPNPATIRLVLVYLVNLVKMNFNI